MEKQKACEVRKETPPDQSATQEETKRLMEETGNTDSEIIKRALDLRIGT